MTPRLAERIEAASPDDALRGIIYLEGGQKPGKKISTLDRIRRMGFECNGIPNSRVVFASGSVAAFKALNELPGIGLVDLDEPIQVEDDGWIVDTTPVVDPSLRTFDIGVGTLAGDSPTSKSPIRAFDLDKLLEDVRSQLKVSSFTVYARDPWWGDGGFSLVAAPGIRHAEPLVAGAYTTAALKVICVGADREWFPEAADSERLKGPPPLASSHHRRAEILDTVTRQKPLFDRLYIREGIVSCARLLGRVDGEVVVSLFANYGSPEKFGEDVQQALMALCDRVTAAYPEIRDNLPPPVYKQPLTPLLRSLNTLTDTCFSPTASNLHEYIRSVLQDCLRAVHLGGGACHATLHLYRGATGMIELLSSTDDDTARLRRPASEYQRLADARGVLSWVALRGQPLLLRDVGGTEFARAVYREIYKGVRSELAIPLFAKERLIGVLNLESESVNAFCPESVRFVCHLGNLAVVACELVRQGRTESELDDFGKALELAAPVTGPRESRHDAWAGYVANKLRALACSVWAILPDGRFDRRGYFSAANRPPAPSPYARPGGWTGYVAATGRPVWLTRIKSETQFEAVWWDDAKMIWTSDPPSGGLAAPSNVNLERLGVGVRSELGIPLKHIGRCVGVAWLKYDRDLPEEAAGFFETWMTGDIRLVGYHLSQSPAGGDNSEAAETGAVLSEAVMHLVDKVSQVPDKLAYGLADSIS